MWPNSGPVTVAVSTTGLARNQKIDRFLQYINIYFLSTHGIILNHSHYSCHLSQVAYNFDFILRPLHYSTPSIFTVISYQGLCFTLHTDPDSIHYPINQLQIQSGIIYLSHYYFFHITCDNSPNYLHSHT